MGASKSQVPNHVRKKRTPPTGEKGTSARTAGLRTQPDALSPVERVPSARKAPMFPWLKFECVTSEKQEVINIAETLGIDKDTVIGKLLRVWTWADHSTNDGCTTFHNATSAIRHIDETARCEGFAIAMQHERWLIITEDGRVTIPNYGRHNGATAKKRMQTLRRMAKYRSKLK